MSFKLDLKLIHTRIFCIVYDYEDTVLSKN